MQARIHFWSAFTGCQNIPIPPTFCGTGQTAVTGILASPTFKFLAEIEMGRIRFNTGAPSPFKHPIHATWKDDARTKVRELHNLSWPLNRSLNDALNFVSFKATRFKDVLSALNRGCFVARENILAFYRIIPVDPSDWVLNAHGTLIYSITALQSNCTTFAWLSVLATRSKSEHASPSVSHTFYRNAALNASS